MMMGRCATRNRRTAASICSGEANGRGAVSAKRAAGKVRDAARALTPETLAALKECGAVYLNAIGGAAQYYARTVQSVPDVNLLDLGVPEAMWHLRVNNFPAIVTMDAHGNSLHADIEKETAANLAAMKG